MMRKRATYFLMSTVFQLTADRVVFILGLPAVSFEVAEHGGGHVASAHATARRRLARAHVILARLLRCALRSLALCRVTHF